MPSARSMFAAARRCLSDIEALALPRACLGCERPMPEPGREGCCELCRHRLRAIAPPVCPRCGQPVDPWSLRLAADADRASGGADGPAAAARPPRGAGRDPGAARVTPCAFCRDWPAELAWAVSGTWLDEGPARNLVHALKYGGWRVAAGPMADCIRAAAAGRLARLDALVPVPLARRRLRERGHNQAAVLARALGRSLGVRVLEHVLRRTRETRTQTRLPPADRWRNVAGAFAAEGPPLAGLAVAVVDDVLTTGATLGSATTALARLGPASIGAVTFARALVPA